MQLSVFLSQNKGFRWYANNKKTMFVKGAIFDGAGNFYEKESLLSFFSRNKDDITDKVKNLNGVFSVVYFDENRLILINDRLRSFPLFYQVDLVSNILSIRDAIPLDSQEVIDCDSAEYYEFLKSGFCIGSSTLIEKYKQAIAGEMITFNLKDKGIPTVVKYFKHQRKVVVRKRRDSYEELAKITNDFIRRLIESCRGRAILLPLSGGYDSRYLLAALHEAGCTNVICYTYGNDSSFEVKVAKKVAEKLGYKLYVVEYTEEKWSNLIDSPKFNKFVDFSFNYSSLTHIQDFIALDELHATGVINEKSIIVPGFCGDLLGGSYVPIEIQEKGENWLFGQEISKYIVESQFKNTIINKKDSFDKIKSKVDSFVGHSGVVNIEDFISLNEQFFTEHKVSKFIMNSCRVYEFFGHEWRVPLWDNALTDFWYTVPYTERINGALYNSYLFDSLFIPKGIDLRKKTPITHKYGMMYVRRFLPNSLVKIIKRVRIKFTSKKRVDINNFGALFNGRRFTVDVKVNNINGLMAIWLIQKATKK